MKYAEVRETLCAALDEVRELANSRHAGNAGDVNEQLELLLQIEQIAQAAVDKVSAT